MHNLISAWPRRHRTAAAAARLIRARETFSGREISHATGYAAGKAAAGRWYLSMDRGDATPSPGHVRSFRDSCLEFRGRPGCDDGRQSGGEMEEKTMEGWAGEGGGRVEKRQRAALRINGGSRHCCNDDALPGYPSRPGQLVRYSADRISGQIIRFSFLPRSLLPPSPLSPPFSVFSRLPLFRRRDRSRGEFRCKAQVMPP